MFSENQGIAITLNVSLDLKGQLQQAARTQGTDVTTYLLESACLRLRPDVLPEMEAFLLQTINAPLAPEARVKRDALLSEQAHRPLTDEEQANLAFLVDAVEMANARRWSFEAEERFERMFNANPAPEVKPQTEAPDNHLNGTLPQDESSLSAKVRRPREFGAGRHLLSGAGIDVDELMATPIDDMFAEYMPEEH